MSLQRAPRRASVALLAACVAVAAGVALDAAPTAGARERTFLVRLSDGTLTAVTLDVPDGTPLASIPLPGTLVKEETPAASAGQTSTPSSSATDEQHSGTSSTSSGANGGAHKRPPSHHRRPARRHPRPRHRAPARNPDGSPSPHNPTFFNALPAPNSASSVPNFVIRQFRVPIFLLPIYQAAGNQYGIRWEVLAAINEIESDYGRNLSVSTAGAVGWMQFLPSTWAKYGVDANGDGKRDPYNPVDAIFAAASYLKAAGGDKDIKRAIFAYNHAGWYVDSVLLRAKLIAGVPGDLIGSLTGLTEGRFPVAAHARYADDPLQHPKQAGSTIGIFSANHAPVVAVTDGVVKRLGRNKASGRYLTLQDAYGNRFSYTGLGSVVHMYPVPKVNLLRFPVVSAHAGAGSAPATPASGGRQPAAQGSSAAPTLTAAGTGALVQSAASANARRLVDLRDLAAPAPMRRPRVFAHPWRLKALAAGGRDQIGFAGLSGYDAAFAHVLGLNARNATLRPLKAGARVVAGTLLGRVGKPDPAKGPHLNFQIRPGGKGAPQIDPKPILDGWKLLESTAIYSADGNALNGSGISIGQILLLSKAELEKRVLHDPRITLNQGAAGRIKTHQIDRRVLATLEFLAESGFKPAVSALTANAVDISQVNGAPVKGHQDKGGIVEQMVRRLTVLQGTVRPDQIVSLLSLGGNTLALPDHANRVHISFRPLFGKNAKLGKEAQAVLRPGQWADLIARLRQLSNPVVPTSPSKFALPGK